MSLRRNLCSCASADHDAIGLNDNATKAGNEGLVCYNKLVVAEWHRQECLMCRIRLLAGSESKRKRGHKEQKRKRGHKKQATARSRHDSAGQVQLLLGQLVLMPQAVHRGDRPVHCLVRLMHNQLPGPRPKLAQPQQTRLSR
jgi:hypothetical protein